MRMDLAPSFSPFDPADRPGMAVGGSHTHLSPTDLSGPVSRGRKAHGKASLDKVAGTAKTGLDALDAKRAAAASPGDTHANIEGYAKQLVSQTFFGTMLKQMRESPFKSEMFEGGRGGQAFGGMYDQKMAEQMSRGAGKRLVNSIVRKLEANKAYAKQGPAAAGGTGGTNTHIAPVTTITAANALPGLHYPRSVTGAAAATAPSATDNHSNRNARPNVAAHTRA